MSRTRAFLIHLGMSVLVVGSFLLVTFLVWYPAPYFEVDGAHTPVMVLAGVDVILGPLLTFVVFKTGKPSLKFDLTVILIIQLSAFFYGAHVIFTERPAYVVHAVDTFMTVPASKADFSSIKVPELLVGPFHKPVVVHASLPDEKGARWEILDEVMKSGKSFGFRSDLYVPYEQAVSPVLASAGIFGRFMNEDGEVRDDMIVRLGKKGRESDIATLKYIPLVGKNKQLYVLLHPDTGEWVGFVDFRSDE